MLDTLELASGLTGYWAMGTAVWLFAPELLDLWRHPPEDRQTARYVFFSAWLTGDVLQLLGLIISRTALTTQVILYSLVFSSEVLALFLLSWADGSLGFCLKPRGRKPLPSPLSLIPRMHGYNTHHEKPPGTKEDDAGPPAKSNTLVKNTIGTLVVLAVTTVVWFAVDYRNRDTAVVHASHLPTPGPQYGREMAGYLMGWVGMLFWIGPRVFCLVDSMRRLEQENITTASISIGVLTHGLNASIFLVNHQKEPLLAQLPYTLTSISCIILDGIRLGYKSHLAKLGRPHKAPEYDPSVLWAGERYHDEYDWKNRQKHLDATLRRRRKGLPDGSDDEAQAGLMSDSTPRRSKTKSSKKPKKSSPPRRHSISSSGLSSDDSRGREREERDERDDTAHGDAPPHVVVQRMQEKDARYTRYDNVRAMTHGGLAPAQHLHVEQRFPGESDAEYKDRLKRSGEVNDWRLMRETQLVLMKLYKELDEVKEHSLEKEEDAAKTIKAGRKLVGRDEHELEELVEDEKAIERDIRDIVYGPKDEGPDHADSHHHLPEHDLLAAEQRRKKMSAHRQEQLVEEDRAYRRAAQRRDSRLRVLRRERESKRRDHIKERQEELPSDVRGALDEFDEPYDARRHAHIAQHSTPPSPPRSLGKWLDQRSRRHSRTRSSGSGRWSEFSGESD
uniref:Uncharacterized protein n=1 Tax=Rhodotorula toruloides TaxID=5286 RepID=A0A0K3CH47_RHOTO